MRLIRLISALLLAGMSGQALAQSQSFMVAGVARKYILYAPAGLVNPPLVFVIHGFNMSGQQEVGLTQMNKIADREKFLVVYPDALPDTANQQSWDMKGPNDFAFLLAIIDSVNAKHPIDRNKVYASGFSQGGFMSFQLGCRYADKFAAIAPVSGLLTGSCAPSRPVPMFLTFGTKDVATPASFMASAATWIKQSECPAAPVVMRPYPASNPNSVVTRLDYGPCKDGSEVVVDSVLGGPHEWPMDTKTKVNNSEEVWAFFKKFSLSKSARLDGPAARAEGGRLSVTYADGVIRWQGTRAGDWMQVRDNRGRLALAGPAASQSEFKRQPPGIYHVRLARDGKSLSFKLAVP